MEEPANAVLEDLIPIRRHYAYSLHSRQERDDCRDAVSHAETPVALRRLTAVVLRQEFGRSRPRDSVWNLLGPRQELFDHEVEDLRRLASGKALESVDPESHQP